MSSPNISGFSDEQTLKDLTELDLLKKLSFLEKQFSRIPSAFRMSSIAFLGLGSLYLSGSLGPKSKLFCKLSFSYWEGALIKRFTLFLGKLLVLETSLLLLLVPILLRILWIDSKDDRENCYLSTLFTTFLELLEIFFSDSSSSWSLLSVLLTL